MSNPGDSIERRHERYLEQARWTAEIRRRLTARLSKEETARLLEVGAGTGAVTADLEVEFPESLVLAIDLDHEACCFGARGVPGARWSCGDAHALPYPTSSVDAVLFHFVLLWLEDPAGALAEAWRVTRPGGWVAALAEPDHAARLDYPDVLARLGSRQTEALAVQGADVRLGRKLRGLFAAVGFDEIEAGVLGSEWRSDARGPESEWETLRQDLELTVPAADMDALQEFDRQAWAEGERVLFVPTFYALGRVR